MIFKAVYPDLFRSDYLASAAVYGVIDQCAVQARVVADYEALQIGLVARHKPAVIADRYDIFGRALVKLRARSLVANRASYALAAKLVVAKTASGRKIGRAA